MSAPRPGIGRSMRSTLTVLTLLKLVLNAGWRFVYPFLPALGRGLGVELSQMGVLLSVRWAMGFATPLGVAAVERSRSSRRMLVVGLVSFSLGAWVTAFSGVYMGALVGFALMGIAKPLFDVGAATYVSERVPYDRRARSLGILELSWAAGFLVGAPLAGWLISTWDSGMPFWVFGSLMMLGLGLVLGFLDPSDHEHDVGVDLPVGNRSRLAPFLSAVAVAGFTLEMIFVVMGAWLETEFALSLFALAGVGALLGVAELGGEGLMVAFTDRMGKRNSFGVGLACTSLALVVLGLVNDRLVPALIALFFAIVSLELAVISGLPIASELRPSRRAALLAWTLVAAGGGRIVADLIGPRVFRGAGMSAVVWIAAASAALGSFVLFAFVREVSNVEVTGS